MKTVIKQPQDWCKGFQHKRKKKPKIVKKLCQQRIEFQHNQLNSLSIQHSKSIKNKESLQRENAKSHGFAWIPKAYSSNINSIKSPIPPFPFFSFIIFKFLLLLSLSRVLLRETEMAVLRASCFGIYAALLIAVFYVVALPLSSAQLSSSSPAPAPAPTSDG